MREGLVESTLNAALDIIDQQFARDDGLYEASLGEDWADLGSGPLQNPQMHLAEAFLQVLAVRDDEHARQSLLQLCEALQAHFIEPAHGLMLEKPRGTVDNWFCCIPRRCCVTRRCMPPSTRLSATPSSTG
ncbi:hypothetical protein D9M71_524360 [compost metagenome]